MNPCTTLNFKELIKVKCFQTCRSVGVFFVFSFLQWWMKWRKKRKKVIFTLFQSQKCLKLMLTFRYIILLHVLCQVFDITNTSVITAFWHHFQHSASLWQSPCIHQQHLFTGSRARDSYHHEFHLFIVKGSKYKTNGQIEDRSTIFCSEYSL